MIIKGSEEEKLLEAIRYENVEEVKTILNNSTENKKILELNEKDEFGWYPLLIAIHNNNIEIVQLLIKYANQHQIILELNEKNKYGQYPLSEATYNNNDEIVKFLIEYANQHQIILKLNEKDEYGNYPLYWAISNNNIEIVQLLIDYALQHQIILKYDKKYDFFIANKPKIKNLLQNYEKEIKKKKKNGANGFRNYSGNISVNSLNKSNNISNPPPYTPLPTHTSTPPPLYSPPPTPPTQVSSSNPLNHVNDTVKVEKNENSNEKGDLAVVLFKYIGTTTDELTLNKGEYLIVTNWDVGDGYAYGYKRNDPQQKGKFPSPLVRKISENNVGTTPHYTNPFHENQTYLQMNRLSTFSENSSRFSISSSPSITRSISQQPPTAPFLPDNRFSYLLDNRSSYLSDNRSSYLSENSSRFSISSSPSMSFTQPPPTAPSEI